MSRSRQSEARKRDSMQRKSEATLHTELSVAGSSCQGVLTVAKPRPKLAAMMPVYMG